MADTKRVGIMNMYSFNYDDATSDREVDEDDYADYKACLAEYMQDDDNSTTLTINDRTLDILQRYEFFAEFLQELDCALTSNDKQAHGLLTYLGTLSEAIKNSDFESVKDEFKESDFNFYVELDYLSSMIHKTAEDDNYLVILKM